MKKRILFLVSLMLTAVQADGPEGQNLELTSVEIEKSIQKFNEKIQRSNKEKEELLTDYVEATKLLAEKQKELDELEGEADQLADKVYQLAAQRDEARAQVSVLQSQLITKQAELEKVLADKVQMEVKMTGILQDLAEAKAKSAQDQKEYQDLQKVMAQQTKDIQNLEDKNQRLTQEYQAKDDQMIANELELLTKELGGLHVTSGEEKGAQRAVEIEKEKKQAIAKGIEEFKLRAEKEKTLFEQQLRLESATTLSQTIDAMNKNFKKLLNDKVQALAKEIEKLKNTPPNAITYNTYNVTVQQHFGSYQQKIKKIRQDVAAQVLGHIKALFATFRSMGSYQKSLVLGKAQTLGQNLESLEAKNTHSLKGLNSLLGRPCGEVKATAAQGIKKYVQDNWMFLEGVQEYVSRFYEGYQKSGSPSPQNHWYQRLDSELKRWSGALQSLGAQLLNSDPCADQKWYDTFKLFQQQVDSFIAFVKEQKARMDALSQGMHLDDEMVDEEEERAENQHHHRLNPQQDPDQEKDSTLSKYQRGQDAKATARFSVLKNKMLTGQLSPQERREYLEILKERKNKKASAEKSTEITGKGAPVTVQKKIGKTKLIKKTKEQA
jgi:hypothetical protein